MSHQSLSTWADRLDAAAALTLSAADISDLRACPEDFRDEMGNRRPVDQFLLACWLALPTPDQPREPATLDVQIWAIAAGHAVSIDPLINPAADGPLLAHRPRTTIEVFTEAELCALHALWTVARRSGRVDLRERCLAATRWHMGLLQPDNATQIPWGIHVFAILGARAGDSAADLDAQIRLHNALAGRGRPDRRSAIILHHAAAELRLEAPTQTACGCRR
jgi:hypothetical protein